MRRSASAVVSARNMRAACMVVFAGSTRMKSASTVVFEDGTITPTRHHFLRSSLICHLSKRIVENDGQVPRTLTPNNSSSGRASYIETGQPGRGRQQPPTADKTDDFSAVRRGPQDRTSQHARLMSARVSRNHHGSL